jgi:toxin HigB-1
MRRLLCVASLGAASVNVVTHRRCPAACAGHWVPPGHLFNRSVTKNFYLCTSTRYSVTANPFRLACYAWRGTLRGMAILSFRDPATEALHRTGRSRRWTTIAKVACRKLDMLDAAQALGDLRVPPANRLEALHGDRAGQHSIRINDQFRLCFRWTEAGAQDVEIVDYH